MFITRLKTNLVSFQHLSIVQSSNANKTTTFKNQYKVKKLENIQLNTLLSVYKVSDVIREIQSWEW